MQPIKWESIWFTDNGITNFINGTLCMKMKNLTRRCTDFRTLHYVVRPLLQSIQEADSVGHPNEPICNVLNSSENKLTSALEI